MAIYSISREELNSVLLDELETMKNVKIDFGAKFEGINRDNGNPRFGGKKESKEQPCDFVVGADGAFSKVSFEAVLDIA